MFPTLSEILSDPISLPYPRPYPSPYPVTRLRYLYNVEPSTAVQSICQGIELYQTHVPTHYLYNVPESRWKIGEIEPSVLAPLSGLKEEL